ncbi:hypothetical protein AAHE18_05G158700 [Arachis hypogaea]
MNHEQPNFEAMARSLDSPANRRATTSVSSLQNPRISVIEFSFPFTDPNLRRSMRSGTNSLLFLISFSPCENPSNKVRNDNASSIMLALSSISNSISTSTYNII